MCQGKCRPTAHTCLFWGALSSCVTELGEHRCPESQKPISRDFTSMTDISNMQVLPNGLTERGLQQLSSLEKQKYSLTVRADLVGN